MVNAMHLRSSRNLLDVTDKDYLLKKRIRSKLKKLRQHHLGRITITNFSLVYLEIAFFAIGSCWYQAWKSASPFECLSERSLAITKMSIEIFLGGRQAKRSFSSRHFCKICKGRNFASRMFPLLKPFPFVLTIWLF